MNKIAQFLIYDVAMSHPSKYIITSLWLLMALSCNNERPSEDKLRCLEILESIDSEERPLVKKLTNAEIQSFKIRPDHDILFSLGTIVHEANHHHHDIDNKAYIRYRLNDEYLVRLDRVEVFATKEILNSLPIDHLDTFKDNLRYKLYIADTEGIANMSTQVNGIYGLLDEYNSYYQDMKTIVGIYDYLKAQYSCEDAQMWVDYFGLYASTMQAMTEFRYFTEAYFSHAKSNHSKIFCALINDQDLLSMLAFLEDEERKLLTAYSIIQREVLTNCSPYIEYRDNILKNRKSGLGYTISVDPDKEEEMNEWILDIKTRDDNEC